MIKRKKFPFQGPWRQQRGRRGAKPYFLGFSIGKLDKRKKFVLTAILLSLGLLGIQLLNPAWRYQGIITLAVLTYWLSAWSLSEGLKGIEWFTVLSLPTLFTTGIGLFYFLIPASWFARLPAVLVYGFGIYVLLLTENIFSVAAIRNIQLLRSAQAVGFLLTLVVSFFLFNTLLSFRLTPWLNFLLMTLISFPLSLQSLWTINLEEKMNKEILFYSLTLSLVLAETALAFSFWPVTVAVGSLALITGMYVALGLFQHRMSERLFKRTIMEYVGLGLIVLAVIIISTRWGGG